MATAQLRWFAEGNKEDQLGEANMALTQARERGETTEELEERFKQAAKLDAYVRGAVWSKERMLAVLPAAPKALHEFAWLRQGDITRRDAVFGHDFRHATPRRDAIG